MNAKRFESLIKEACHYTEAEEFRQALLELFELHYLSALMSFNTIGFSDSEIQQRHFPEMQYGFCTLAEATGDSPSEIIDNALHTMIYHDVTYTWCTSPLLGSMSCYYSAKALFHQVKKQLE